MNKINFQNLPSTTTPVNATNLNTLQTNVENAINAINVYVAAETVIGTWVDGKPLYRRVFTGTASASGEVLSTTFTYNLISSDCAITFYNGTNYIHFVNFVTSDYNCGVYGNKDTGRLIFYYKKGTDTHSADYKVIVTYTKPTD